MLKPQNGDFEWIFLKWWNRRVTEERGNLAT